MNPEAMSLMPVPPRNPINAPMDDLNDAQAPLSSIKKSARKAPRSVPRIIPIGGMNKPMNNPAMAPRAAALLPPVTRVKYAGMT